MKRLIIEGWQKRTGTAQTEQLCLEHGICGFAVILSTRSGAGGHNYWRRRSILGILSCREGCRAARWLKELLLLEMYQYRLWG